MDYFVMLKKRNKRVDFVANSLRSAKIKACKEMIYAGETAKLFEEDNMGGLLKSVKKDPGRWEDSFIEF